MIGQRVRDGAKRQTWRGGIYRFSVRRPFVLGGALALGLTAIYRLGAPHYKVHRKMEHQLALAEGKLAEFWRGLVGRDAGLDREAEVSTQDLVVTARNFVCRRMSVRPGGFHTHDPVTAYLRLSAGTTRMLCDGMADAYRFVLSKLGIRSRRIQLATARLVAGDRDRDTHVSVEVYDDNTGHWYASDPTFNVSWRRDGETRRASYEELRSCHAQGRVLRPDNDGQPLIEGRRIEDYYLTYDSLLFGLRVHSENQRSVAIDLPYAGWWEDATNVF